MFGERARPDSRLAPPGCGSTSIASPLPDAPEGSVLAPFIPPPPALPAELACDGAYGKLPIDRSGEDETPRPSDGEDRADPATVGGWPSRDGGKAVRLCDGVVFGPPAEDDEGFDFLLPLI